jgi:undecaprenyl-diphosphatase
MREMIDAAVLGAIEALTEFLPVSSTGHLIVAADMLGFDGPPGKVFEVVIQMGAILAVMVVYFQRLWNVALGLRRDPESWKFAAAILLAFLPAAVIGVFLHKYIKGYLFNTTVVAISMIVGGIVILIVERIRPVPKVARIEDFSPALSLKIGFIQCLAMVPGVSRSGATILGALLMGVTRKTAAEFSFFLAIPTLTGAAVYDTFKNRAVLSADGIELIAIGFAVAFVVSLWVIRWFVDFVGKHGFGPFAWYRIVAGSALLAATVWMR